MMICDRTIKRECEFSRICGMEDCMVADDSECADFIAEIIEQRYLAMERKEIQEETEE